MDTLDSLGVACWRYGSDAGAADINGLRKAEINTPLSFAALLARICQRSWATPARQACTWHAGSSINIG
eukprot:8495185-Pyramimonas_sp.AAC.1